MNKHPSLWTFLPAITLTLAISFLLTLYGPLELYFTNVSEFHFDFRMLLPELLKLFGLFVVAGLAVFSLCYILYIQLYHVALAAAAIGFICTYIQGMFLVGNLPPLDGRHINWAEYSAQDLQSILLWCIVGVAVVLLIRFLHMKKMYRVFTSCALFLTSILLVTVVVVGIQNDGLSAKSDAVVTKNHEFDMSTDQNLVIFVVDAADSGTFNQMLQSGDYGFQDILADFTYYPNTVGAYPFTKHAIPYILHGAWYENQEDFNTFTTRAMDQSPLLSTLQAQNYRMGIYEEDLIYGNDNIYQFENVQRSQYQFSSFKQLAKAELKLVWFKYAPYPLKRMVKVDMEVFNRLIQLDGSQEVFSANNADFYQDAGAAQVVTVADKCFRFIHIEGAHVPFRYDKDVNLIDEAQGTYPQNMECSMTILARYLTLLKDSGVYDNSAILIMADHGYGYEQEIPIVGRCNPLLLAKGVDEHHPLAVSDAPISYEDLQTAYQRLLSGASSDQLFDAQEGDDRVRRILLYFYEKEEHMAEYQQHGHASDITTLLPTGNVYDAPHHGPKKKSD